MAHIPTGFDPSAGQSNTNTDFPQHIFEDGEEVVFRVHKAEEKTYKRHFAKGKPDELNLPDCELWSFQIIVSAIGNNQLSNMVFLDIVKDGRAWDLKDKNGKPWVQNKFINLCTGFGLRKSKEQLNINPAWFTEVSFFTDVVGKCKVAKVVDNKTHQYKNEIQWFIESQQAQQAQTPVQQTMAKIVPPANGATVDVYNQADNGNGAPVTNPDGSIDDGLPF